MDLHQNTNNMTPEEKLDNNSYVNTAEIGINKVLKMLTKMGLFAMYV